MSAINPFREAVEPAASSQTVPQLDEWEQPAWDESESAEASVPELTTDVAASWYERETPFLSLDRSAGNDVAPPDPLAAYSLEAERRPEESQTDRGGRMPWDISIASEATTPEDWTSEASGAEPLSEALTFFGREDEFGALPEQEHEDTMADSLKNLLAKGYWSAAVMLAIIRGERDRNKLTNMVFWARHPEIAGKKIPPGNKELADDWKKIYKLLVLPPLGPVSPSTVGPTAVPNEQKSLDTLIIDIFNSEQQVLTAWSGALTQFQVVMKAHSDAEGAPDFVGAVMKHVGDQVISKIAEQVPGVSYAKGVLDALTKDYERAREARTSAQLRNFLVGFTGRVTDAMNNLGRGFGDYKHMVETTYAKLGSEEKKQYQKALADHLSSLDTNWKNVNQVFLLICQEWIRNTMYAEPPGWLAGRTPPKPAWIRIYINKDYSVRGIELFCHGGQKIADEMLKNSAGEGLRLHMWPVPKSFFYFERDNPYFSAYMHLTSDGNWVHQGDENAGLGRRVLEHIRMNGLEATTKVKGR